MKLSRDSQAQAELKFTLLWSSLLVCGCTGRGPQKLKSNQSVLCVFVCMCVCVSTKDAEKGEKNDVCLSVSAKHAIVQCHY